MDLMQKILKSVVILCRQLMVAVFVCREHARYEHTKSNDRRCQNEHAFIRAFVTELFDKAEKKKKQDTRHGQLTGP